MMYCRYARSLTPRVESLSEYSSSSQHARRMGFSEALYESVHGFGLDFAEKSTNLSKIRGSVLKNQWFNSQKAPGWWGLLQASRGGCSPRERQKRTCHQFRSSARSTLHPFIICCQIEAVCSSRTRLFPHQTLTLSTSPQKLSSIIQKINAF
jgi:hypothetical protein